ncbi:MAG: pyruvate formate lyase family protein, partial [Lentisphaeria bacterium]|nr:pyruvate formate lyase family protein [Lentisphaeria bacterium]
MNQRIQRLLEKVFRQDIFPEPVSIKCDPFEDRFAEPVRNAKRLTDYMLTQPVVIHDESELAGLIRFNATPVPADLFPRLGHNSFGEACSHYYRKPQENLCTFEWQHSNPDLAKVISSGLHGYIDEINKSRKKLVGKLEHLNFLTGLEIFIQGLEQRVEQYRACCIAKSEETTDPERKTALRRMARNLEQVPMHPARNFEEA